MRTFVYRTLCAFLLIHSAFLSQAQGPVLRLENGEFEIPKDLRERLEEDELPAQSAQGRVHALLSFDEIPNAEERAEMEDQGLRFIQYLPENSYIVGYDKGNPLSFLPGQQARSIQELGPELKMAPSLFQKNYPTHAVKGGAIQVQLTLFPDLSYSEAVGSLKRSFPGELLRELENSKRVELEIPKAELGALADHPAVMYMEAIDPEPTPDSRAGRSLHRSNVINGQVPGGDRYTGDSIVMAIADDGGIGPHIDIKGRVTDHTGGPGGTHGDMTSGIAIGAGNLDPTIQGMATGAHLHMYDIDDYPQINNAITNLNNLGTRITSTSYSQGCNNYDSDAANADGQIHQNPQLIHVFSAGNSAFDTCGYGVIGWGNITGGTKQGKNVIATGNLDEFDVLSASSSRGPAEDGRIKPDLCAHGAGQLSTEPNNQYGPGGGTSAAAPGIAGVIAQLYEAYQDLNNGNFPPSALIKAALQNTAEDLDDHGPDFNTGWGRIDAGRAYQLLEEGRYMENSIGQGGVNNHSINVPSGVEELRVMIHWADPAGSPSASQALVNDLNMTLTTPSGTDYDPWVLDHTANQSALDAPATRDRDSINNTEQVTLQTPSAGNYDISVEGYDVPMGPQPYFLVYEFIQEGVELTYPRGGEGFVPDSVEILRWNAHGNTQSFDLSYSVDSGSTWHSIASGVNGSDRHYTWTVPDSITGDALVQVERGSESDTSQAPFAIIDRPENISLEWACPDSARLSWDSVEGAVAYEVYMLGNEYMDSIGTTTDTAFTISPYNSFVDQWVSVSAVAPGMEGRRANAVLINGGVQACPLDTNLALELIDPLSTSYPSCQSNDIPVEVKVKNPGMDSVLAFDCFYEIDGNQYSLNYSDTLAPDSSVILTFQDSIDLPTGASFYPFEVWVEHPGDNEPFSDSAQATLEKVSSSVVALHYSENFEGLNECVGNSFDCDHICNLGNGLTNQTHPQSDDIDWRVNMKGTPSNNTGPSFDHDPGTIHGKYLYLEASNGCEGMEGGLLTPCLDISNADPELRFSYHMDGFNMGELHVDALVDGEWHLDIIPAKSGDQGSGWQHDTVDLSAFQGELLTVRFRGITGDGFRSDIGLDGVRVIDRQKAPEVNFTGSPRNLCPNRTVELHSLTVGAVDEREWRVQPTNFTYVNGTGPTSKDPDLFFTDAGTYEVELWASNSNGSDSLKKSAYITVGAQSSAPIEEDFEASVYPPVGWKVDDGGGFRTWEEVGGITGANGGPTRASVMENFEYGNNGAEEILETPILDISNMSAPVLSFDVAYASYNNFRYEALEVRVSGSCGEFFSTEYDKEGDELSTFFDVDDEAWVPTAGVHWRRDSIELDAYQGSEQLRIRFVNVNGNGNNLYIDNVNIADPTSLDEKQRESSSMTLYPNPASDRLIVKGKGLNGQEVEFRILDVRGRVLHRSQRDLGRGPYRTAFDLTGIENGIYYLERIDPDGGVRTEKFVVQH